MQGQCCHARVCRVRCHLTDLTSNLLHYDITLNIFVKKNKTMGQIATTIRIDAKLKAEFDKLCEEFGMSANTAFNIYVKTVIRQRRIPFAIEADPIDDVMERGRRAFYEMRRIAAENGTAGMSLDEINEEIRLARRGE